MGRAADQVAGDHEPGRDPDPRVHRADRRPGERPHLRRQLQPRPDRPLGVVLLGPRVAEIGQHAVAQVLRDVAAEAPDRAGDAGVEGADQLAQVLGVEPRRERGRPDEVDEHHGEVPPLGARECVGPPAPKARDRLEEPQPVPERQPEILQVLVRQLGQDLGVDRRVPERGDVLTEAQALEPGGHVHAAPLPGRVATLIATSTATATFTPKAAPRDPAAAKRWGWRPWGAVLYRTSRRRAGGELALARPAGVVELVDTRDLGSRGLGRGGSSPFARTRTFQRQDRLGSGRHHAGPITYRRIDAGHRALGPGPQARVQDHRPGGRDRGPGHQPPAAAAADHPDAGIPARQGAAAAAQEAVRPLGHGRGAGGGGRPGGPAGRRGPPAPPGAAAEGRGDLVRRGQGPRVQGRPRGPARGAGGRPGRPAADQARRRRGRGPGRAGAGRPGEGAPEARAPGRAAPVAGG